MDGAGTVVPVVQTPTWPEREEDVEGFIEEIMKNLVDKGHSIINMPALDKQEKLDLTLAVDELNSWELLKKEFEEAYLGRNNSTKYCSLSDRTSDDPLTKCQDQLSDLLVMLAPYVEDVLGFPSWGRLSTMVRVPLNSGDTSVVRHKPLQSSDYEDGNVFGHLNFLERRKISLLYMVQNSGGEVLLLGEPNYKIPVEEGRVLVWRQDLWSYSYRASHEDTNVALQSWILSEPWGSSDAANDDSVAVLPEHMEEENRVSITALQAQTGGAMQTTDHYWNGILLGVDGQVEVPVVRWDHELYYSTDGFGMAYCKHGGFIDSDKLLNFDAAFFNVSDAEMPDVAPGQRLVLDNGYTTLHMAGFTKDSLRGQNIAHFIGDSHSDWINLACCKAVTPTSYIGSQNSITAMRVSYTFGLKGPCQHFDTACSSSLVACNRLHVAIKKTGEHKCNIGNMLCEQGLVTGLSVLVDPHLYIGYSGAGMLSRTGRCFTFDTSANGFARGEGCVAGFLQSSEPETGHPEMMAALVGSFTNQDGRSVTMTAPNGRAQSAATMASLEESGFHASDVSSCECHGTGTSLGDPIEFQALRTAFAKTLGMHPSPLSHTSAKTSIGHGEANAGIAGLAKCVMTVIACANPPNNHLKFLNPNLDMAGYPAYINDLPVDFGPTINTGLMGVSSFGSGGTNARADVWARCQRGACRTIGLADGYIGFRKKELYIQRVTDYGLPGPQDADLLSLVGTWDAWSYENPIPMRRTRLGEYQANVVLGESLCEQFHIILNHEREAAIHPDMPMATMGSDISGPDPLGKGLNWKIDGRKDQALPGASYFVTFSWSFDWERGESKKIFWTLSKEEELQAIEYTHRYFVVSSWSGWKFHQMVANTTEPGVYSLSARIGNSGQEEFQIVRDRDWTQVIHPATHHPIRTSVPVQGPDEHGTGKKWLVRGPPGFKIDVELKIAAGCVEVSQIIEKKGRKKWKSSEDDSHHDYYVCGSWNNWGLSLMTADSVAKTKVFRLRTVFIGGRGFEEFKIVLDRDVEKCLFPVDAGGKSGLWKIEDYEAVGYEIVLDMSSRVPWVTWSQVETHGIGC